MAPLKGACVAQCPNGAAQLFTSAKVSHLGLVPQGQPERLDRVVDMVAQMEAEAFGSCTNHRECEAVCPKEIPIHRPDEPGLPPGEGQGAEPAGLRAKPGGALR